MMTSFDTRFDTIVGMVTVGAVIASYASGVWGIYGHFVTDQRVEPAMKLTSLLSLVGLVWFLALRGREHALTNTAGLAHDGAALAFLAASMALFWWAIGVTRRRRLTLAFSKDQPSFVHSDGPYAWVRHPFYTSYILFWTALAIASASLSFWLMPAIMTWLYLRAIRLEEAKFASSPVAYAYDAYRQRTGMLIPLVVTRGRSGART
jgi:protein-S-isoprenylcysteine O-methyltransferase Ste14